MSCFSYGKAWFHRGRALSWNLVLWLDRVVKYVHVYPSYVSIRIKHPTRMRRRCAALIGQFAVSPLLRLVYVQNLVSPSPPKLAGFSNASQRCITEVWKRVGKTRATTDPITLKIVLGVGLPGPISSLIPAYLLSHFNPALTYPLMSDFKLGIVRLGRVAGKVSWILGLPCATQRGGEPRSVS